MAEVAQNPWVQAGVEVISHSVFYDPISIGAEYTMAVYNAYQEVHHDTNYTVDANNSDIDHRADAGMEHKARDGLEDNDHHQEQSANNRQDTLTDSFDDISSDRDGRTQRDRAP